MSVSLHFPHTNRILLAHVKQYGVIPSTKEVRVMSARTILISGNALRQYKIASKTMTDEILRTKSIACLYNNCISANMQAKIDHMIPTVGGATFGLGDFNNKSHNKVSWMKTSTCRDETLKNSQTKWERHHNTFTPPYICILCHFANYALCLLVICTGGLWKAAGRVLLGG